MYDIMAVCVDLKPRKELLNLKFEGYKLSLESLSTYFQKIENGMYILDIL